MDALCISLGHNSSAILIRDGKVMGGYEMERFTRVKSDSTFPIYPIQALDRRFGIANDVEIMIGHWALDGNVNSMVPKHWDPKFIKDFRPKATIQSLDRDTFTHHDSHAYSAISFAGSDFPNDDTFVLVIDGFGTLGEHISVYKLYGQTPVLQWRKFGFGTSLGLFYQYTTAFLQMKQNQDEYKLLAYEAHIEDAKSYIDANTLDIEVRKWTEYFCDQMDKFGTDPKTDPLVNIGALPAVAKQIADFHNSLLDTLKCGHLDIHMKRIIIAYFAQSVVEGVIRHIIDGLNPTNLILTGGLFYNVKVNSMIARHIKGKTCIMPLAGDQGAALGIYHAKYGLKWPGHVYWGHRDLGQFDGFDIPKGVIVVENDDAAMELAANRILDDDFVNIVRGPMEFGPRALCHTSTLGRADIGIGHYINHINGRTNEMPFAPVISPGMASEIFAETDKIWKSLEYMIVTRDYKGQYGVGYRDAAHIDVNRDIYTGRPQITNDPQMVKLLRNHDLLINTSFNYHGVPIVFQWEDILHTHNAEAALDTRRRLTTIVVTGDIE